MSKLPVINTLPVHDIFLPVSKQHFKYVPYTIEQERNLLTSFEGDDVTAIVNNYAEMIAACAREDLRFDDLSAMEFILLAVSLRAKSKGEVMDISTKCKKCDKLIEISVNIEDNIQTENEDKLKTVCKIDDALSFELVPVKVSFLLVTDTIKTTSDLMLETAVHSIDKVFFNEEIYKDFTPEEIKENITFTHPMLKKIFESVSTLIRMAMVIPIVCEPPPGAKDATGWCGHKEEYVIRDFLKYLN